MLENNIVYMIKYDWSDNDCQDVNITLYKDKKKAIETMLFIIETARNDFWNEYAFIDGKLDTENFELVTNIEEKNTAEELYWELVNLQNYYIHDFIELRKMEIK